MSNGVELSNYKYVCFGNEHTGDCRKAYDEISKQGIMCKLQHVQRIKYKITGRHISDVYFEDDQFKKQYKVQRLSKLTQSY